MPDVTISGLTAKATPVGTDEIEIQETGGGTSKKCTLANAAKGMDHADLGASIGTLTHAQIDTLLGSTTPTQTIWMPASAMVARTTSGAASGTAETTTNKVMVSTLDFDASTDEFAQFTVRMPKGWNEGTITASFSWSNASGTGDVVWAIQGVAIGDDDALDAAFGTAQTVTDSVTAAGDLMQSAATSACTIAGTPAEGDLVVFQVYRDADAGGDTLAGDARLHGVSIYYVVNTLSDA